MSPKNIFAILLLITAGLLYWTFVDPFKTQYVDSVQVELDKLRTAYDQATQQIALKTLRIKKQQLTAENLDLIDSFIPATLHSGRFVYNLSQLANQNGLTLKGLQYSVIDDSAINPNSEKKLQVELAMDGRYESFVSWLQQVERSNVLIDVESIRGVKNQNSGETISFTVRLYAYGLNIN